VVPRPDATFRRKEGEVSVAARADDAVEAFALTDVGTERDHNEDACAVSHEAPGLAIAIVADGVSLAQAGEIASGMAVEVVLRAFRDEPERLGAGQRLYRAVQQANIEIHDRAMVVPELRGMSTTLTAAVVDHGELTCVHVGDSRLYLLRGGGVVQLTKDHTVAADRVRYGLLTREGAREHPERSTLTRSVGRELIVSRDRLSQRLEDGDVLVLCSDGLHGVLDDDELARVAAGLAPEDACRKLIATANARGTPDNLSAAVLRIVGLGGDPACARAIGTRLRRLLPW
jgi:serine/threonine protein phosphatase PrpC